MDSASGPPDGPQVPPAAVAKTALRDQLATARTRRTLAESHEVAQALARLALEVPEVRRAATVACYVAVGREPGTGPLLDALVATGTRVVLPLTVAVTDGGTRRLDLDWAVYAGPDSLAPARFGLLEPITPPLGPSAVATADALLVPGMAVSATGVRIGKGAGCYDRALARVPVGTFTCVLLHADEVGRAVPSEPHDLPVTAALTPAGLTRFD